MWKRIHSNRNPNDTLYSELRKEFRGYFELSGRSFKSMVSKKPWWSWSIMVFSITASVILSFTVFRYKEPPKVNHVQESAKVSAGFSQILTATDRLRRVILLKQQIDSLSARPSLNKADSARLIVALDSLAVLQKFLNQQHHEH